MSMATWVQWDDKVYPRLPADTMGWLNWIASGITWLVAGCNLLLKSWPEYLVQRAVACLEGSRGRSTAGTGSVELAWEFCPPAQRWRSWWTQRGFCTCDGDGALAPAEPAKITAKGKREGGKSNQRRFELNKTLNRMENSIRLIRYLP